MGRARRGKNTGGGGLRPSAVQSPNLHPLPNQESIILDFEDECITYYSPKEGRMIYIDSGIDMIASGTGDYPEDDAADFVPEVEAELLQAARKKLLETGEIGLVAIEKDFEFDVYAGPSHDRLDQTWEERRVTIEMLFDVKEDSETWEEDDPKIIEEKLSRSADPRAAEALQAIQNAADEPDASSNLDTRSLEDFEEKKERARLRELARERAEEIAEDRDQADWNDFSKEERERRVIEAEEIIRDEGVSRAESAAEGRTAERRPRDVSDALSRVASGNEFIDLQNYGEYGVLSDMISMYNSQESDFTDDQIKLARDTIHKIERIAQSHEQRGDLPRTIFSEEGLRVAEEILRELSEGCDQQTEISSNMMGAPTRSDEAHCLAMADYLAVLRTGKAASISV